jgi:Rrf2 family transcriptional regulator, iron-sulfur cluster assembly transcription factor
MKLSTRSRYGTRLMLDMAEHCQGSPIQLGVIARRQGIPVKYLEQIIIPLKKAGYVSSVRGYKGGYMLAKPPEEENGRENVVLLERGLELTACTDCPANCDRAEMCVMRRVWQQATDAMSLKLNEFTFADLIKMMQASDKNKIRDIIR